MRKVKVLVIYENVPEDTVFYVLELFEEEEILRIRSCHGRHIGSVEGSEYEAEMSWLSSVLPSAQRVDVVPGEPLVLPEGVSMVVLTGLFL